MIHHLEQNRTHALWVLIFLLFMALLKDCDEWKNAMVPTGKNA
jgi:hypothetical protein